MSPTRVYYVLTFTRWFPTGFVVGLFVLWALDLGLGTAQAMSALAAIGLVVALLELPTSGFTDVFGRRPVYVAAAVVQIAAAAAYLTASSWGTYLLAGALMGVFRALESGPLEAWFVDAVHERTPGADVDQPLARASSIIGASMAASSLLSGGLVAWHPMEGRSALELPMALFAVLTVGHLVAVLALMREVPHLHTDAATPDLAEAVEQTSAGPLGRALASAKAAPAVVVSGLRLVATSAVLRGLVLASGLTSVVMVVQETFSLGAVAAGRVSRRIGVARTALLGRAAHCVGALVMGVVLGPVALVAAYLLTYGVFGSGVMHRALLHREASASNRATVLSIDSMVSFFAFAVVSPSLGLLAERTSTQAAVVTAALVGLVALVGYLPALRAERVRGDSSPAAAAA